MSNLSKQQCVFRTGCQKPLACETEGFCTAEIAKHLRTLQGESSTGDYKGADVTEAQANVSESPARSISSKEESSFAFRFAKMWHDLIGSPVMNTRRYTEAQGMMEEADAEIARLRADLTHYGRHTHPNCYDLTLKEDGSFGPRNGCLCGLDAALSGDSSAAQEAPTQNARLFAEYAKGRTELTLGDLLAIGRYLTWLDSRSPVETTESLAMAYELLAAARAELPDPDFVPEEDQEIKLRKLEERIDAWLSVTDYEKARKSVCSVCRGTRKVIKKSIISGIPTEVNCSACSAEETSTPAPPVPACANPVMINAERYRGCVLPSGHEGECSPRQAPDNPTPEQIRAYAQAHDDQDLFNSVGNGKG